MKGVAALLIGLCVGAPLWAMPSQITFQGTLKQQGVPVNGQENMQFSFVDANGATIPGTTVVSLANVTVTNGLFAVPLPIDPTIPWAQYTPFVQVSVQGQILSPNQPIGANLYAMVSQTVADGAITTVKLASNAVTTPQIATGAVTTPQLASGAVTVVDLDTTTVVPYLVPSGMVAMFAAACPTGWTRFAALDNLFPMGGVAYGVTGGSATHTHTLGAPTSVNTAVAFIDAQGSDSTRINYATDAHAHSVTTESNIPPYLTMVFCQKT